MDKDNNGSGSYSLDMVDDIKVNSWTKALAIPIAK